MDGKRKILLALVLAGILLVTILTWGSVGSAFLVLALLLIVHILAVRKAGQEEDYYEDDQG